eukprot:CAMPEP_0172386542 /NCGR_PEP_ID=MMETSP1061-20121228/4048_1 /TAXON_ID=37318 /ORGANISM="Pseudo-nitzschia pungens, Strain cf. pungens" /LENGTH=353 /DNA_ID=CAMNT_0013115931 /DNA_START=162 /DNA_END=1223 /DNA_ORIENTATION=+
MTTAIATATATKQIPIVCPGHTRPLAELQYVHIDSHDAAASASAAAAASASAASAASASDADVYLLSACHDKMPMIRDGATGDWIGTWMGHKGAVWSCQMDPTGNLAATASGDYSARVWDAITGQSLIELPHKHIVKTCVFSPNSQRLATGGKEASLRIYELPQILVKKKKSDPAASASPSLELPQESPITKLAWVTDDLLLCSCMNGKIYLWNTTKQTLVTTFNTKEGAEIRDMEVRSLSGSQKLILSVAAGSMVYFFDISTPESYQLLKEYKMPIHFRDEGGCTLHPSGKRFVAGGSDLWVRVFDFETGEELECHKGHHGPIRCVRFSPDGKSYASGSEDGTIRLWKTSLA